MSANSSYPPPPDVAGKAVRAVFWNYLSFVLGKALLLVTTAVLARLLSADEFGTVGFAVLVVTYLTALKDLGLGSALIQRRDDLEEAANTVFTLNLLFGIALALISFLIAPGVARFFRDAQVTALLRVMSATFIFNALGNVHSTFLRKTLSFNRKLIPDLARSLSKGLVAVILAFSGAGVWALVFGQVASAFVGMIASWLVYPWRPRLELHLTILRSLFGFGASVLIVDAIAVATDNLDYLIIGRALGSVDLGIYTIAYRLPEMLILNSLWILASVLFPAYSIIQDDRALLKEGFLTAVRYTELAIVPLSLGLVISAEPIVFTVFGDKWAAAIPVLRILAIFTLVNSIAYNVGDVYKAIGRPDVLVKIELFVLVLLIPTLIVLVRFGIVAVAVGHLAVAVVHLVIRVSVARNVIDVGFKDMLVQMRPALLGGVGLLSLAWPALVLTSSWPLVLHLATVIVAGVLGYLLVLWVVERDALLKVIEFVNNRSPESGIAISMRERET